MLTVTVSVFGIDRPDHLTVSLDDGATVSLALSGLDLPAGPLTILVNGRHAPVTALLTDGDRVSVFPQLAGGLMTLQAE